ncbi:hypothetical protein HRR83_000524 [Exophiala dermatitidis]|uniref:Calcineurin-like phosphoesterase domain-containing protein n=1 Tax=Exophiala dermatitidis TaxID=5970 RepID=A0AAN6F5B5_EXODE|nr:hypothetical protein HRR75_000477 [Exophiala dermatitidis]KAJ4527770.1 hypothetical protein HRR74_000525 [Exophiala dermatitidis]KAJ4528406.1 hypothetical protein HRR73_001029 [Exophiala dermatitidis]KAJ4531362.1 hypothetical protein HRR76_009023 [Exophiala dermatitidis]KAJ4552774.1 hypothetical protein HRR78_003033 [Exophiala dermatitidis]
MGFPSSETQTPGGIKTRILIISDTHSALPYGHPGRSESQTTQNDASGSGSAASASAPAPAPSLHSGGPPSKSSQFTSTTNLTSKLKSIFKPKPKIEFKVLYKSDSDSQSLLQSSPFRHPLPSADVLLHCGDLTMNGSIDQHRRAIELIDSVQADLKIVIPGNHDITLDRAYYERHPNLHASYAKYPPETLDEIRALYDSPEAKSRGIRYLEEGTESFVLRNGARLTIYASAWQPEFWNWAFGYERGVDRFNVGSDSSPENPVPGFVEPTYQAGDGSDATTQTAARAAMDSDHPRDTNASLRQFGYNVDIMLTHGPPYGILDRTKTNVNVGCEHLRRAVERCRPRVHCFGHIHEAWGAERKKWEDTSNSATSKVEVLGGVPLPSESNESQSQSQPQTEKEKEVVLLDATDITAGKETLFVNASIMNLQYKPVNAPWLVDLMLSPASAAADG